MIRLVSHCGAAPHWQVPVWLAVGQCRLNQGAAHEARRAGREMRPPVRIACASSKKAGTTLGRIAAVRASFGAFGTVFSALDAIVEPREFVGLEHARPYPVTHKLGANGALWINTVDKRSCARISRGADAHMLGQRLRISWGKSRICWSGNSRKILIHNGKFPAP